MKKLLPCQINVNTRAKKVCQNWDWKCNGHTHKLLWLNIFSSFFSQMMKCSNTWNFRLEIRLKTHCHAPSLNSGKHTRCSVTGIMRYVALQQSQLHWSLDQVLLTLKLALTYTFTHTHTHTHTLIYMVVSDWTTVIQNRVQPKSACVESRNEEIGLFPKTISLKNEWMNDEFLDKKKKKKSQKNYKFKTHLPFWGISVPNAALFISCPAHAHNTHGVIADNTQKMVSLYIPMQHCQ